MSRLRQIRWPLGRALVIYMLLLSLVATLLPFRFRWPPDMVIGWSIPIEDLIYNILFFLPLGFLYRLTRGIGVDPWHLEALGIGLGISATIELAQLCLPGRVTSFSDVAANGIGMWLGSMLHDRLQSRVDGFLLGRLTLELPLVMLAYLILPLMWINGRAAQLDHERIWLQALLGVVGAIIIASLRIHRAGPVARMDADKFLFAVVGWSGIGSIWAFMEDPNIALLTLAITVGTAMLLYFVPVLVRSRDRRFEIPTLLRIGPFFLAYLTLLAIWPLPKTWPDAKWTGAWGLSEIKDGPGLIAVLQLLEYVLTFTMFGYILGQLRGRARESKLQSLLVVMVICAVVSGALEVMRGYHPGHSASFLQFALCVAAGTYGGYLYQAQLATIRLILAR